MSKKILVVDDEPDSRETVRFILEAEGYEVLEAEDGQMGVEMVRTARPDLVIMDMMMPKKDGFVACMEIKKDPSHSKTPILMLSGIEDHVRGESASRNIQSGLLADLFMAKPIEPAKFLQAVSDLLALKSNKNSTG